MVKGTSHLPVDLDPVVSPSPVSISSQPGGVGGVGGATKTTNDLFEDHWLGYGGLPSRGGGPGLQTHPLSTFISDGRPGGGPSPPRFLWNVIEEEYEKQQGHLGRHHG